MENIRQAQRAIEDAHRQLEEAVIRAREEGSTWAEIGNALGMSRQAAFKRFGKPKHPITGDTMAARNTDHLPDVTEKFFRLIADGDEELVMGMMHHRVRKELPWSQIIEVWTQVVTEHGELEGFENTFITTPKGMEPDPGVIAKIGGKLMGIAIGVTTINLEAGEMMGRVAFDNDDAVVGIYIVPVDTTEVPF